MALYVRQLEEAERDRLRQLIEHPAHEPAHEPAREPAHEPEDENDLPTNRLQIVALSAEGKRVPEISEAVDLHPINVRKWIHRFNQDGFDGLRSGKSPGRPPVFTEHQRQQISAIATTSPRVLGLHFSRWSLQRLRRHLIDQNIVQCISVETVRQIIQSTSGANNNFV